MLAVGAALLAGAFVEGERLHGAVFGLDPSRPAAFGGVGLAMSGQGDKRAYQVSDAGRSAAGAGSSFGWLQTAADAAPAGDSGQRSPAPAPLNSNEQQLNDLLSSDSPEATFQQVYLLLKDQFVDSIPSDAPLAHGAAQSLLWSLDEPNSRFVESFERKALEDQASGLFQGIGAAFTVRKVTRTGGLLDRQITIVDALPGSPAEKAGLKTGDVVSAIDGHWVMSFEPFSEQLSQLKKLAKDPYNLQRAVDAIQKKIDNSYSLSKAQAALDTTSATALKLTVIRPGITTDAPAATLQMTLDTSVPLQVKDVESRKLDDGNGYVAFNVFTDGTATDFQSAVVSLGNIKGLVIDLRDCPGGQLSSAIQIAQALAASAPLGQVSVRSAPGNFGDSAASPAAKAAGSSFPEKAQMLNAAFLSPRVAPIAGAGASLLATHPPVSVLVNKGTANVAEMLAAFLHDQLGARVVGSATFGDAMTQTLFPLTDGSAFTLTTGRLKTDKGIGFYKTGLAPEYPLADPGHADFAQASGAPDEGLSKAEAVLADGLEKPSIRPLTASAKPSVPGVLVIAALPGSAKTPAPTLISAKAVEK